MKLLQILNTMDIKGDWQLWCIKFLIRKQNQGANVNELLTEELHKPVTIKFKRWKVYARFNDNIWAADLAEMGSFSFD